MQQPAACAMAGADLELGRLLVLANLHAVLAARAEPAAVRRMEQIGRRAGDGRQAGFLAEDRDGRLLSRALV